MARRHNHRAGPALEKMEATATSMAGKALPYAELVRKVERGQRSAKLPPTIPMR